MQCEDPEAEVHQTFTERLVRCVGALAFPDAALCRCQPVGDTSGEFLAQFVDGESAAGQDRVNLGGAELDGLREADAERGHRLLGSGKEMSHRLLRGGKRPGGEHRGVGCREEERRAPHTPRL